MVDSLEKNLKALKETLKGKVNEQMKEIFTRQSNKRPENFRGIENMLPRRVRCVSGPSRRF